MQSEQFVNSLMDPILKSQTSRNRNRVQVSRRPIPIIHNGCASTTFQPRYVFVFEIGDHFEVFVEVGK